MLFTKEFAFVLVIKMCTKELGVKRERKKGTRQKEP